MKKNNGFVKKNKAFFKTLEELERGWLWNGKHIERVGGTRIETEYKEFDFNDDIQKVFQDTKEKSVKVLSNEDKVNFFDLLDTVGYFLQGPTRGHPSARDKYVR